MALPGDARQSPRRFAGRCPAPNGYLALKRGQSPHVVDRPVDSIDGGLKKVNRNRFATATRPTPAESPPTAESTEESAKSV